MVLWAGHWEAGDSCFWASLWNLIRIAALVMVVGGAKGMFNSSNLREAFSVVMLSLMVLISSRNLVLPLAFVLVDFV